MSRVCWQGSPWLDRRIGVDVISLTSSWEVPHRKWVRLQEVRVLTIPAYSMLLSFSRKTYLNSFVSCPLSTCWPRTPCPIFFCRMNSMRFVAFLAFAIEKLLKWNIRREREKETLFSWLTQTSSHRRCTLFKLVEEGVCLIIWICCMKIEGFKLLGLKSIESIFFSKMRFSFCCSMYFVNSCLDLD